MEDLTEISKWLKDRSKTLDFIDIYHGTRSSILKKSLEWLKDHLGKRSAAPSVGAYSPMVVSLWIALEFKAVLKPFFISGRVI